MGNQGFSGKNRYQFNHRNVVSKLNFQLCSFLVITCRIQVSSLKVKREQNVLRQPQMQLTYRRLKRFSNVQDLKQQNFQGSKIKATQLESPETVTLSMDLTIRLVKLGVAQTMMYVMADSSKMVHMHISRQTCLHRTITFNVGVQLISNHHVQNLTAVLALFTSIRSQEPPITYYLELQWLLSSWRLCSSLYI